MAVAGSSGQTVIDWEAAALAAKESTPPGSLALTAAERRAYATDVREARMEIERLTGRSITLPGSVEIQDRHHWIDANSETFRRIFSPLEAHVGASHAAARTINTATMSVLLGFLGRNVLGQYDPLLLADGTDDHALYFVHPNIDRVATELSVDFDRFRRWIAFHEVTHAAEFTSAPWLSAHLERNLTEGLETLTSGQLRTDAFEELDVTMTVVEGYAELLMDHAFDDEYADLRVKLDERRAGGSPLKRLLGRLLGLGIKRRQYERGKHFFETVAANRSIAFAEKVWASPAALPTTTELDDPYRWIQRMDNE